MHVEYPHTLLFSFVGGVWVIGVCGKERKVLLWWELVEEEAHHDWMHETRKLHPQSSIQK